jgi:hypothetical protein
MKPIDREEQEASDKGVELAKAFNRVIHERYSGHVSTLDVAIACGALIRGYIDQAPKKWRIELRDRIVGMIMETKQ